MKIAFVNDSCQKLGIQYISSVLKKGGHQTRLFIDPLLFYDEVLSLKRLNNIFDYKEIIISQLKNYKPDLIGISVVTDFYQWACQMAQMIKQQMDVPIIFGGIHPSSVPERVIQNDFVDIVCVGEGEYPMLELVDSMEKGRMDYSIKNLWFKKDGKIIKNEIRPLIENLDALPFADLKIYLQASPQFNKGYYIASSRGCPHYCSYCVHSYMRELYRGKGNYLRRRSVESVIQELVEAKREYSPNLIFFIDDCFGQDLSWLREFAVEYKNKIGIKFYCSMFPSHVCEESIKLLKEAGCREIEIGIQSWDEKLRFELLHRLVSNEVMERAMFLTKKSGINLITGEIIGLPGQKQENLKQRVQIYGKIKPERAFFFTLKYYPRTTITRYACENNMFTETEQEKILDGAYGRQISKGGDITDENVIRLISLFFLIKILPQRIIMFIVDKKLYRYFPAFFSRTALAIVENLISGNLESEHNRVRAFYKYTYFMRNKIAYMFGVKRQKN